jgi:predicted TIM-barrel fold metal-dependent hydrolase
MKAARQFFDQMPINVNDKEKIGHLNAERLLAEIHSIERK